MTEIERTLKGITTTKVVDLLLSGGSHLGELAKLFFSREALTKIVSDSIAGMSIASTSQETADLFVNTALDAVFFALLLKLEE